MPGSKIHLTMFWSSLIWINNTKSSGNLHRPFQRARDGARKDMEESDGNTANKETKWLDQTSFTNSRYGTSKEISVNTRDISLLSNSIKLKWSGKTLNPFTRYSASCLLSRRCILLSASRFLTVYLRPWPSVNLELYLMPLCLFRSCQTKISPFLFIDDWTTTRPRREKTHLI